MVERLVWDQEVAGSNPVTPILSVYGARLGIFFMSMFLSGYRSMASFGNRIAAR